MTDLTVIFIAQSQHQRCAPPKSRFRSQLLLARLSGTDEFPECEVVQCLHFASSCSDAVASTGEPTDRDHSYSMPDGVVRILTKPSAWHA